MNWKKLIKETLREDQANRGLAKHPRPLSEVRSVAVLFDAADYAQLADVTASLTDRGIRVRAWSFQRKYSPVFDRSYEMFVLNGRHIGRRHRLPDWAVNDFLYYEPDLLVDLSRRENPLTDYLAALSKAPFKIGFKKDVPERYGLIYDVQRSRLPLADNARELFRYYEAVTAEKREAVAAEKQAPRLSGNEK